MWSAKKRVKIYREKNAGSKEQKDWSWKRRAGGLICKETIIGFIVAAGFFLFLLFGDIFLDEITPLYVIHDDRLELMMYERMPRAGRYGGPGGRTTIWFQLFGGYQVSFEDIERIGLLPHSAVELSRRIEGLDVRPAGEREFGVYAGLHGYRGDFYLHVSRREGDAPTLVIERHSNPTILLSYRRHSHRHQIRNLYRDLSIAYRRWRQANGLEQEADVSQEPNVQQLRQQRTQDVQRRVRDTQERARELLNRQPRQRSR